MLDTILQTKLFIPAADGSLVVRQRLLDQLDQFPQRRLTLITAPAGFGKTTLITHWLRTQTAAASCWLSLDEQDNDPHRFLAYVAAAFQQIAPHIGADLQTALQSSTPLAIEALLTTLLNELTTYKRPCLFVLDDFHLLTDTTVQEIVAFLIEHRPPNLHLIITSRTALPFSVAKWRVRRQLLEITTADLRFNHQEAAAFLQQAMHLDLNAADIAALEQRTEGWVAGLQLAALSLNGRTDPHSFINSFTGDNRYIIDYLLEEVFKQQPEHIRTFLLHTAVLDRFCADLCDAVLDNEIPPSQTILEYLEQHHLFLIPLDAQQKWFRYHHLFTDFLRYQLQRLYPERLPPLNSRAGRWYTQQQQRDEAMRYAVQGQDWSLAAELIYEHGLDLIVNGEIQKLTRWFAPLPADLYTAQPLLSIYEGWVHMFSGRFEAAHASIAAVQQAPHDPTFPLRSFGKAIQAFVYLNRGRPNEGEPLAEAAIRELDEALTLQTDLWKRRVIQVQQGAAVMSLADVYYQENRFSEARAAYERALAVNQESGNILAALGATWSFGDLLTQQGELHHAAVIYDKGFELARLWAEPDEHGRFPLLAAASLHFNYGTLLYEWNRLDEAQLHLDHAAELAKLGGTYPTIQMEFARGLLALAQGNIETAERFCQSGIETLTAHAHTELALRFSNLRYNLELLLYRHTPQDDIRHGRLERWWQAPLPEIPIISLTADYALARFRIGLTLGYHDQLLAEIPAWQAQTKTVLQGQYLSLTVLQALALQAQHQHTAALETLTTVLNLAKPEGYIRLFVDEGKPLLSLLQLAYEQNIHPEYTAVLLEAMGQQTAALSPLVEPLSGRELEVLHLMAQGHPYQAIADELIVSVNTVRYHTKNLYGKLGVNNRAQAIAKAHDLELLK